MTIDERLERLVARHEALAETVELLTADIRQNSEDIRRMAEENKRSTEEIRLMAEENRERDRRWDSRWMEVAEAIARLAHIAEIHESRITRLEGGG